MLSDEKIKQHLDIVTYFSKSIFRKNTVDDVLWDIISNCIEKLSFVDCVIYLLDKDVLIQKAAYGDKNINFEDVLNPIRIPLGNGIVGTVAKTGIPEIISDTRRDSRYIVDDENRLSEIAVPIFDQDRVIGVIDSEHPDEGFYEKFHLNVLEDIASISGFKISTTISKAERDDLVSLLLENPNPVFRVSDELDVILKSKSAVNIVKQLSSMSEAERYRKLYHAVEEAFNSESVKREFFQLGDVAYSVDIIPFTNQKYANMYLEDVTDYYLAKKQAEQANRAKAEFLSSMSHEIRTPLNSLLNLNRLLSASENDPEKLKLFEAIEYSGDNLLTIVNDILDFEKLEAGKVVFQQKPFAIRELIDQFYRLMLPRANDKSLCLKIRISEDIPETLLGDENRLLQILSNLVVNALKFTEKGEISVHIDCAFDNNQHVSVKFEITDTGIGISEDQFETVFRRFEQAHPRSEVTHEGSGLGLSITQRLVRQQKGTIEVKSALNQGTKFTVILPFKISDEKLNKIRFDVDDIDLADIRVLVVDDSPINILVVKKFLLRWSMIVFTAENGQQAVDICEHEKLDIVLMDLQMPVLDGYKASKLIRTSNDLPIIAMSADVISNTHKLLKEAGINDHLEKPFHPTDLKTKIYMNLTSCS